MPTSQGCKRFELLEQVHNKALDAALQGVSYHEVMDCFPGLTDQFKDLIYDQWNEARGVVGSHMQKEFQVICAETNVKERLAYIEKLIEDQPLLPDGTRVPPSPEVAPTELLLKQRMEIKKAEKEAMEKLLAEYEAENETMKAKLEGKRAAVETVLTALETKANSLESVASKVKTNNPIPIA